MRVCVCVCLETLKTISLIRFSKTLVYNSPTVSLLIMYIIIIISVE